MPPPNRPVPARLLSLAAGVLPEFTPEQAVHAAAEAGFDAAGIWHDRDSWTDRRQRAVRDALENTGLVALDMEVLWLQPGQDRHHHDALIDAALALGAHNLLCISSEPRLHDTKRRFEQVCRRAGDNGLRVVLEFMIFTEVRSLADAVEVVTDVGAPAGGVLVDALHLQRTGGAPRDLADLEPRQLPYVQICDAPLAAPATDAGSLLEEALWGRLLPGCGELPLAGLLAQLDPQLPVSAEIRSRALAAGYPDADARARVVLEATRTYLDAVAGDQSHI